MGVTYPTIERWIFAEGVLRQTIEGIRAISHSEKEAGAFWLGERQQTAHICCAVLPHGTGVEESDGRWVVAAEVFGAITRWAKPRELCLLGVAHCHVRGVPPKLSWTDRNLGVRVPGLIAAVIGNAGEDTDYRRWGWYVFENDYRRLERREIMNRISIDLNGISPEVWTADSTGVHLWETR